MTAFKQRACQGTGRQRLEVMRVGLRALGHVDWRERGVVDDGFKNRQVWPESHCPNLAEHSLDYALQNKSPRLIPGQPPKDPIAIAFLHFMLQTHDHGWQN